LAATSVVSRENVESWTADSPKLLLFRKALEAMQGVSDVALMDERGYQWVAAVHGGFGGLPYCKHGNGHFLTWHRPYILDMELKLRAQIARFVDQATADEWRLPYWDWAARDVQGLPEAFTAETYDDDGTTRPNPLRSAPYRMPFPVDHEPPDATWRAPSPPERLQALRPLVEAAMELSDYHDFRTAIENPHNKLHGWVGGFMSRYRSAFDPLFWVHHANIDRQFWQWQRGAGHMASIPRMVREYACQPFRFKDIRAEAFFDTRALGYTYSEERQLVVRADALRSVAAASPLAPLPLDFGRSPRSFARARVNVHGMRHPEQTCELVFFANRGEPADASTEWSAAEGFLGSYMVLGHGPCPGAPGHCDPDEQTGRGLRPPHHLAPFDLFVDVTAGVQQLTARGAERIDAQMIVVDDDGEQLPTDYVAFDNVSLTFR
jgi:tyrosinase